MKHYHKIITVAVISAVAFLGNKAYADDLIGLIGGMSFTSNPPAMQSMTGKSHFVDGNGGWCYLYHNQVTDGYAFETQFSMLWASTNPLKEDGASKCKFIVPLDFRWFLGTQTISAYLGAGLQYSTVWRFTKGEGHTHTYYDPWWGVAWDEEVEGEEKWDWTVNQLSTNLALGFKVGFWNGDAYDPGKQKWVDFKRHALIIGTKVHLPIINASEEHGSGDNSVDLSRDKVGVSLTGALSFGFTNSFTLKLDYEYPLGGSNKYKLNDGGHATWFNTNTQSMSVTLLFRI
mgnify:FL=1